MVNLALIPWGPWWKKQWLVLLYSAGTNSKAGLWKLEQSITAVGTTITGNASGSIMKPRVVSCDYDTEKLAKSSKFMVDFKNKKIRFLCVK